MKLSVIVVSFNSGAHLAGCLDSLVESRSESAIEIFVVDNASSDDSLDVVRRQFPDVHLVANDENVGFARASNQALAQATGELVLFLNPDTAVTEEAIDHMASLLGERPAVGAVGPRLRREDGSVEISHGPMHSFSSEFLQKLKGLAYADGRGPFRRLVEHGSRVESHPDWVSGACLMTRRDLMERTGGFDENYFLYVEDVDLCARIRALGFQILYTPGAEVVHLLGRSVDANRDRAFLEAKRSRLHFYDKHYGRTKAALFKCYLWLDLWLRTLARPGQRKLYRKTWAALR